MLIRSVAYTGNSGGECNATERLAHCLRCNFICPYCGCDLKRAKVVSMDHVIAQVWGGTKNERNMVECCGRVTPAKSINCCATSRLGVNMMRRQNGAGSEQEQPTDGELIDHLLDYLDTSTAS